MLQPVEIAGAVHRLVSVVSTLYDIISSQFSYVTYSKIPSLP